MEPFLLIFVCTGNICRSPLAEGIMKEILRTEAGNSGIPAPVNVLSAGTHALPGIPASEHAVLAAAENGIDISRHLSQPLTDGILGAADLILTMERTHTELIQYHRPLMTAVSELKTFARTSLDAPSGTDVMDPIGSNLTVYRRVFDEIDAEIRRIAPVIIARARAKQLANG